MNSLVGPTISYERIKSNGACLLVPRKKGKRRNGRTCVFGNFNFRFEADGIHPASNYFCIELANTILKVETP